MGGKIGFESEENKGSTFWAWFPTQTEIVLKHGIKKPDGLKNLTGNIIESK